MASTIDEVQSPLTLPLGPSELFRARSETWPVWKDYGVVGGYLRPSTDAPVRHYKPQDRPELPFEIAKLATSDEADMVRFARRWGLLGHYERWLHRQYESWFHTPGVLREPGELVDDPGDPVDWVRDHAKNLANCISLVDSLARDDQQGLFQTLRPLYGSLADELLNVTSLSERAWSSLSFFVNPEIERIRPALQEDGTIGFKYTAMVEVAYVHTARLASDRSQIDRCEECGAPFKKTHGLQRFCPPGPFDSESRCSYKHRYKRFKSREEKP